MTDRLPSASAKDLARVLLGAGYVFQRQKGSHIPQPLFAGTVVVPMHPGDLKRPLLKAILQQAGIREDEFRNLF